MQDRPLSMGRYQSPMGELLLAWRGDHLVSLDYLDFEDRFERLLAKRFSQAPVEMLVPAAIRHALDEYFGGETLALDAMPVEYAGTEFEDRVWRALHDIAPGTTATYGELAARLGAPNAARAVGRANSMNPIAIVVPCHRVIGANSKLTGYAGGLERKQWLLEHERKHATSGHRQFFATQSLF